MVKPFAFYRGKRFFRYSCSAVTLLAIINLQRQSFSRTIATFEVPSLATIHAPVVDDRYLSKNGSTNATFSSVQTTMDVVVLTNTTKHTVLTDIGFGRTDDADNNSTDNNTNNEIEDGKTSVLFNDSEDSKDTIMIIWKDWTDLERMADSIFISNGNYFCDKIKYRVYQYDKSRNNNSAIPSVPKVHVLFELSCHDLFLQSAYGTGNFVQAIYMMRLAVQYLSIAKIKLNVTCIDLEQSQKDFVLPWFSGTWYSPNYFDSTTSTTAISRFAEKQGHSHPSSPKEEVPIHMYCGKYSQSPIAIMYEEMQHDVRRMAIAIAGISLLQTSHLHSNKIEQFIEQNIYHTGALRRKNQNDNNGDPTQNMFITAGSQQERFNATTSIVPLLQPQQPIEFDDAIIHFRCGDVLSTRSLTYGFMTFHGYSRHLSPHVCTIGILTQPFGRQPNETIMTESFVGQHRDMDTTDANQTQRCGTLVFAFVDYLKEHFPNATVNIRNDPSETIALAYTRMVLANQTVSCMTTFSVFPIVGTFGTGYFLRLMQYGTSSWLSHWKHPITKMNHNNSNVVLFDEPYILLGYEAKDLWDTYGDDVVLQWFRTGTYTISSILLVTHYFTHLFIRVLKYYQA